MARLGTLTLCSSCMDGVHWASWLYTSHAIREFLGLVLQYLYALFWEFSHTYDRPLDMSNEPLKLYSFSSAFFPFSPVWMESIVPPLDSLMFSSIMSNLLLSLSS